MKKIKITDVRAEKGDSAFLIDDGKTAILYDSGFAFTGYAVAENIRAALGNRALDYIFLTHSHYDHALGSAYVKKYWPQAKTIAAEYAATIFKKPSARAVMRELDRKFATKCGAVEYDDLIDELNVDIMVNDGDKITAGELEFTVIALPGHTKCSVGYYLESEKLLLSSETIGVYDGEDIIIPSYLIGYETTLRSIEKAEKLAPENILLPHHGLLDREKTVFYLSNAKRSAAETAEEIKNILVSGGTKEDAFRFFKDKFYREHIKAIYPEDAMELNTSIMINLIEKELILT